MAGRTTYTPQSHQTIQHTSANNNSQAFAGTFTGNNFYTAGENISDLDYVLKSLPIAEDAQFNALSRQDDPVCLPGTRTEILTRICDWASGQDERCIFWLKGLAGTGKSTIARTVARIFHDQGRLGASVFFSRGGGDISQASRFVTTLAAQLASNIPSLDRHVSHAIRERRGIGRESHQDQWHHLVLRPFMKLGEGGDEGLQTLYMVVLDALDECDNDNDMQRIVSLLAKAQSIKTVRLRVLITSRPEVPIRTKFDHIPNSVHQVFVLHNIPQPVIDHDISIYFHHHLDRVRQENGEIVGWPGEENIRRLTQRSGGLFIWADIVCRFLHEGGMLANARLRALLENTTKPGGQLDELYTTVLQKPLKDGHTPEEQAAVYSQLRTFLGSIVILFSPLSAQSLCRLLSIRLERLKLVVGELHAIMDIPELDSRPLRLHHPSLRDFLLDSKRCHNSNLLIEEKQAHHALSASCLKLMSRSLKEDICGVGDPNILADAIKPSRVTKCLPAEVQYACLYWVEHVMRSGIRAHDGDDIEEFLQNHVLHWIEALSWMGKVLEGVQAIVSLTFWVSPDNSDKLSALLLDAKHFVLNSRECIEKSPLQAYSNALIFSPETNLIRRRFQNVVPRWIRKLPRGKMERQALQSCQCHRFEMQSLAFSSNGRRLASASRDGTINIWHSRSGALQCTLRNQGGEVVSLAFSPNGKKVASGSRDGAIKVWHSHSGALQRTFVSQRGEVLSLAFSPDGKRLRSVLLPPGSLSVLDVEGALMRNFMVHPLAEKIARIVAEEVTGLLLMETAQHLVEKLTRHLAEMARRLAEELARPLSEEPIYYIRENPGRLLEELTRLLEELARDLAKALTRRLSAEMRFRLEDYEYTQSAYELSHALILELRSHLEEELRRLRYLPSWWRYWT